MSFVVEAGALVGSRYTLETLVGAGGMGQVWSGLDRESGGAVAIKFLKHDTFSPDLRRRLRQEARATAAISHPAVVPVRDVIEHESGDVALVMDLLEGEPLSKKSKPMPLRECVQIVRPVAEALAAAHAAGIVHRDVKPDNVFITTSGEVKILDFGIAKRTQIDVETASTAGTQTGAILGTPAYMSPEQAFAEPDIDHRTDIWSLGLVLYECLSGVLPTSADSLGQVLKIIVTTGVASVATVAPALPPPVVSLVDAMLQRDRSRRPQTMQEVLDTLNAVVSEVSSSRDLVVRVSDSDSSDAWGKTEAPAQSASVLSMDSTDSFLRQIVDAPASVGSTEEPDRSGQRISHYQVADKIGQGGMGIVYAAEDVRLHRRVALKVLPMDLMSNEGRKKRFLREARSASAVQHANVATVFDVGESEGTIFIAMEHVEGQTLRALLRAHGGKLESARALDIATQMAKGLARAHEAGVIHRDVKPENVMITPDGTVKLLDFGLAKLARASSDDGESTSKVTDDLASQVGRVLGTPAYMSPEQAAGGAVDARTDVYAMGVVLHEMLVGKRPGKFQSGTGNRVRLSAAVTRLIDRCLREDPAERFASGRELVQELTALGTDGARHTRTAWLIGGAVVIPIAALGWWASTGRASDRADAPAKPSATSNTSAVLEPGAGQSGAPTPTAAPITPGSSSADASPVESAVAATATETSRPAKPEPGKAGLPTSRPTTATKKTATAKASAYIYEDR